MIDENEDSETRGHINRALDLEANEDKNSSIIKNQKTSNDESESKTSLIASKTGNQDYQKLFNSDFIVHSMTNQN